MNGEHGLSELIDADINVLFPLLAVSIAPHHMDLALAVDIGCCAEVLHDADMAFHLASFTNPVLHCLGKVNGLAPGTMHHTMHGGSMVAGAAASANVVVVGVIVHAQVTIGIATLTISAAWSLLGLALLLRVASLTKAALLWVASRLPALNRLFRAHDARRKV